LKRTLILVKHSEPVLVPGVAPNRWVLSERGRFGSVLLGERLARYGSQAIVSSEEPKAVETAEIVAEYLGVGCSVHPGLHEHNRTGIPFLSNEEFQQAAGDLFENPDELVWGNETAEQARSRFESAVRRVLDEREEEVVTIVAHGTVISLFVARYNDVEPYELWQRLGLPSFCVLTVPGFELRAAACELKLET
jgi:broad specificity phosphatase PhoE